MNRENLIKASILAHGDYALTLKYAKQDLNGVTLKIPSNTLVIKDPKYPRSFYELKDPPLVLYYYGKVDLLNSPCIGVVGSRKAMDYSLKATKRLVDNKKERYTIVSGLAKGVDAKAHESSLDQKTIGVLGSGIDYIYPYENKELYLKMKKDHLIISEYPYKTAPLSHHFPWRNRLIAALSKELYVMQASRRSGTLISVNYALELGREVFALPYDVFLKEGEGTNLLIEEGANMILF